MEKFLEQLIEKIKKSLEKKFPQFDFSKIDFSLEPTSNPEMGDFGFPCDLSVVDSPSLGL